MGLPFLAVGVWFGLFRRRIVYHRGWLCLCAFLRFPIPNLFPLCSPLSLFALPLFLGGSDKSVATTLVYDSEVAKGLVTEPWAPQSRFRGNQAKQHLLPLNARADRLAERGRSGAP